MVLLTYLSVSFLDESTVSALNAIRVCADDFEMKSIIGRGHFGEVSALCLAPAYKFCTL